jgi:hypothetical protein
VADAIRHMAQERHRLHCLRLTPTALDCHRKPNRLQRLLTATSPRCLAERSLNARLLPTESFPFSHRAEHLL